MEIITAYPTWYLLSCALVGLAFAAFMYYKSAFYVLNRRLSWLLGVLRAAAVALLVFLLFNPFIKTNKRTVEKPIVVIATDNSNSILLNKDSIYYKKDFAPAVQQLKQALQDKADVQLLHFGNAIKDSFALNFTDKSSNFEQLFGHLRQQYANRNLGAVVFASDGIYNTGENPLYSLGTLTAPIYTIALGDTTQQNDLIIKQIRCNEVAFKGNQFAMEIDVLAKGLGGRSTIVELLNINDKGNVQRIDQKNIAFTTNTQNNTVQFLLDANQVGVQHYKIKAQAVQGEISTQNNMKDVFVEILEQKQKVLLLANAPHPDLSAIKQALESSQNTEVTIGIANAQNSVNAMAYNTIFLHNLPSQTQPIPVILNDLKKLNKPVCYIVGKQTNLVQLNAAQSLMQITANTQNYNQVQAYTMGGFSLFVLSPTNALRLEQMPPLDAPFGNYTPNLANADLLRQKIGAVRSDQPLITFSNGINRREAMITGEGLWKWHFAEFEQYQNHDAVNELLLKINQFLQVRNDKKPFIVKINKKIINETEEPNFIAELYNQTYEPINTPEVRLTVTNSKQKNYTFIFARTEKNYALNISALPADNYTYTATTNFENKNYKEQGSFSVLALNLEALNTTADHSLLYQLSTKTNGKMVYPAQMAQLAAMITQKDDFKPLIYNQSTIEELINYRYLLLMIAALLGIEWLVRKLMGKY